MKHLSLYVIATASTAPQVHRTPPKPARPKKEHRAPAFFRAFRGRFGARAALTS